MIIFGGKGVFKLSPKDTNLSVAFEMVSENGRKPVLVQRFVPEATRGDKRILLVNGDPIGAVLRVHSDKDHRNNVFAGGKTVPSLITERDLIIISELKPHLQKLGLFFVGIDIIGDYLIEVNVTSPTCLVEMSQHSKKDLAKVVINAASL